MNPQIYTVLPNLTNLKMNINQFFIEHIPCNRSELNKKVVIKPKNENN